MSAFMQGLQTGSQTARGWIDTYEDARKRREAADLKSRREGILTAQPEYSQGYTAEQGQQLEAMASAINPETGRPYYNVQAGQGGNYTVTPDFTEAQTPRMGMDTGSQYGVAPVELQTTGLGRAGVVAQPIPFEQQRVANFLGGRVEGDLAPERMELMRSRALANTIADPMERQRALIQMDANERAAARDAQDKELTGLRIDRERDTVTREQKNREATQALSQQLSSGNPPDVTQIYKLASDFGVDPAPLVKLAADNLGLDEKTAKAATEKLVKQINAASTSPEKFRTLLETVADPDPLDNIKPELRETKNGYRVFYGDEAISPEFKESKDMTALQQLAGFYRDTISGKPMETAITMATLDAKRAAINASEASATRDRAVASAYADGSRGAKGGLKQKVADFKEVYGRDPTEAEKGVLAGLTNKPREVSNADINARAKLMIDGGMMDPDDPTKPLSPQRAVQMATAELSGVPFVSPVDQLILDMAAARNPKAATSPAAGAPATTPAAAPAPRGSASLGPDPNRPQSGVSPVTGLSRETPVQAPNLIAAAGRGLDAGQARYKAYLESKIANRQPLTADERIRAQRFGLQ